MAISNGDFEEGDLTGWTDGSSGTGSATVQDTTKYAGTYALKLISTDNGGTAEIHRGSLVTSADYLDLYVNVSACSGENSYFRVYIWDLDSASAINWDIETTTSGFELQHIDITSQLKRGTDGLYIALLADAPAESGSITAYVDNLAFVSKIDVAGTSSTATAGTGVLTDVSIPLKGTGSTATAGTGTILQSILLMAGTSETGTAGTGTILHAILLMAGTSETATAASGNWCVVYYLAGTSSTATAASSTARVFLTLAGNISVPFDSGSAAWTAGETVTGATTGANGTVSSANLTGGSYVGGDAAGTVVLSDVVGDFIDNENLNGSTAGNNAGTTNGEPSRIGPKVVRYTISKGIDDNYATATITCRGIYSVSSVANFSEIEILLPDYSTGVLDEQVFLGVVPDFMTQHRAADDSTILNAVGHMWYLANRQMPDEYLSNTLWDSENSKITYYAPEVVVTALFGGALYSDICGIDPSYIISVADWNYPLPGKGWAWNKSTKRIDAIREMAEYLDYFIETTYDGTHTPNGVFAPLEDADDYTPDPVTFAHDDETQYIVSIKKNAPGSQKPSLVTVTGARNYRILHLDDVTGFVAEATITDGGTGAEATIKTVDAGENTIVIEYDRTGDFVDGNTVTSGAASDTMAGNDEFYELYDYYSYSYPVTSPNRAVEYFENCPQEYDSTSLIEGYATDLYTFLQMDNNEYTVVFNKRTDLRLWQSVTITGYTEIPEEEMRIVHITYDWESPRVTVTCTLRNSEYVLAAAKMKRTARYSDEQALESMVKAYLDKHLKIDDAEVLAVEGEGYTVELVNGEIAVRAKGTE